MVTSSGKRMAARFVYPFNLWNQIILKISTRLGGAKAREFERFLKFATVGIIGAVIDFGVLNVLQATLLHPVGPHISLKIALATGIAFTSAVTSNFVWNRYWTYPDSRSRALHHQVTQFFIVNAAGLVFRLIWVKTLYGPFGNVGVDVLRALGGISTLADAATRRLGTNIAQFFAVWIVMVWNFFANRYWTYNDVE
jgi:putative flippase GtrA